MFDRVDPRCLIVLTAVFDRVDPRCLIVLTRSGQLTDGCHHNRCDQTLFAFRIQDLQKELQDAHTDVALKKLILERYVLFETFQEIFLL